jgi:dolichol-phosphate mannosyltransferase
VYRAEFTIEKSIAQIKKSLSEIGVDYELILVDDGSPDRSWELIAKAFKTDRKIKGIKLSRNFGQHYAITAGLANTAGDWVVVLDCDLQDDPKEITNLHNQVLEGYNMVLARRSTDKIVS